MRRITRLILHLATIGMVVGLPATSQACLHGPGLCWWCKSGAASYGYSAAVVPTGVAPVVGTTAPVGGSNNPNAPIPASAPALAYPGAAMAQPYSAPYAAAPYGYAATGYAPAGYYAASSYAASGYAAPAYAAPAYAAPTYAAPGYAPSYAAPGYAPAAPGYAPLAGQPSQSQQFLAGYDNNAPLAAVGPGMLLSNSQLVASHIFQNLRKFGAGLDESGLLDLAARLLGDATGIRPVGSDVDALRKIVTRFRSEGSGTTGTLPVPATGNTGATVVADGSTVTITAPPGVRVLVIQGGRSGGSAGADAGNQAVRPDDTDVPQQPTIPPSATPPARNPRSTPQDEPARAPTPIEPPAAPPAPAPPE